MGISPNLNENGLKYVNIVSILNIKKHPIERPPSADLIMIILASSNIVFYGASSSDGRLKMSPALFLIGSTT